jgi:exonuclease SbcC
VKLNRVEFENVCQHRHLVYDWQPGLNGILGPNGSGKSNILKGLRFAITGQFDNAGTKLENVYQGAGEKTRSRVVLDLEHNGTRVEIIRVLRRGTSSCRIAGGEQIDGDTNVTTAVMDVLGINPRIVSEYVFVPQRKIGGFIDETAGERAKTFQQLFGTEVAAEVYQLAGEEIKRTNPLPRNPEIDAARARVDEHDRLCGELERALLADRAALAAIDEPTAREVVETYRRCRREQDEIAQLARQRAHALASAAEAASAATAAVVERDELRKAMDESRQDVESARDALARWKTYEARQARLARIQKRQRDLEAEVTNHPHPQPGNDYDMWYAGIDERIRMLTGEIAVRLDFLDKFADRPKYCPTCGADLPGVPDQVDCYSRELPPMQNELLNLRKAKAAYDFYQSRVTAWEQWKQDHDRRVQELAQDVAVERDDEFIPTLNREAAGEMVDLYESLENSLRDASEVAATAESVHAAARARAETLDLQLIARERVVGSLPAADIVIEATRQLKTAASLREMIATREGELRATERALAQDRAMLSRLEAAERKAEVDRLWVYHLEQIRAVAHPSNLPRVVAENYLEILADDTNDILEESDAEFRVRLGQGLGFVVEFLFGPSAGVVTSAQRLSEGQKVLLALAFRVAVNSLFAGSIGLLCLDEPTESLDAKNIGALEVAIGRLRDLSESRGLQCLLVTHEPSLERLFDGVLRLA